MVGQSFAVDEILHLSVRDLRDQRMPPSFASAGAIKDVIFLPIRLGAESSPGSHKQRGTLAAPAATGQVLEIQQAVVGIHWRLQWANGVETLHQFIATRPLSRDIHKANTSSISALQVFPLMAYLGLIGIGAGAIGGRGHAQ